MMPPLIAYIAPVSALAVALSLLLGARASLQAGRFAPDERAAILANGAALLVGWYAVALALSFAEFFRGSAQAYPTIEIGVLTPIVIGSWLMWRSEGAGRLLEAVPQSWIVGVQIYRALGFVFLVLMWRNELPGQFAWPAGVGDVVVGLTAPLVAIAFARGAPHREAMVLAWNVFGLLDLAVAVSLGFLTSPSPLQMLALSSPNELISAFPLAMVPVFLVPLSVLLHFASLVKLERETQTALARS